MKRNKEKNISESSIHSNHNDIIENVRNGEGKNRKTGKQEFLVTAGYYASNLNSTAVFPNKGNVNCLM